MCGIHDVGRRKIFYIFQSRGMTTKSISEYLEASRDVLECEKRTMTDKIALLLYLANKQSQLQTEVGKTSARFDNDTNKVMEEVAEVRITI